MAICKLNPIKIMDRATPVERIFFAVLLIFIVGIATLFLELVLVGGLVLCIYDVGLYIFIKNGLR